jgi:hypothetical protein
VDPSRPEEHIDACVAIGMEKILSLTPYILRPDVHYHEMLENKIPSGWQILNGA